MTKVKATVIAKDGNIPTNKSSIPLNKESKQTDVENRQNELIVVPPYDVSALATLFNMNAYHKRCCLVKAGITVRPGFTLYDPDDAAKQPDDDHTRASEFLEANVEELHNFVLDYEVFGNGFLEVVRNGKGEVAEIYHIGAKDSFIRIIDKVRTLREQINGALIYYVPYMGTRYQADKDNRHEYIHWKNYNPENRYYGAPEYTGAISAMYLDESAKTYNTNRFSDPVPETLIALAGMSEDSENEEAIKRFFTGNFGDKDKAGRKALLLQFEDLVGGLKEKLVIEKLERDNKDAAFRGLRTDNREEIISAHGLSPRLVGLESISKLGGGGEVREQLKLVNEIVFIPRKNQLSRIVNSLLAGMGITNWKVKFNNFEFANAVDDATFYSTMVTSGIITPEFAAQEMGYPAQEEQGGEITKSAKDGKELVKIFKSIRRALEENMDNIQ